MVHERCLSLCQIGDQAPGAGADAEAMTREACGQDEARQVLRLIDDRYAIGGTVDIAGPACLNRYAAQGGQ
ncbi:hypothetical protein D9M68_761320 [compost metagenome]